MVFTAKPQFRGRKLFFKIYFLPSQTTNIKFDSLSLIIFPPIMGDRVLKIVKSSKSMLKGKKKKAGILF